MRERHTLRYFPSRIICTYDWNSSKHPQLLKIIKVKSNHSINISSNLYPIRNNPLTRVYASVTQATHHKRIMNVLQHPIAGIPHTCATQRAQYDSTKIKHTTRTNLDHQSTQRQKISTQKIIGSQYIIGS